MEQAIATAGIACLIAAAVGGGLKAFGVEIPALQSRVRQLLLAVLGAGLLLLSRNVSVFDLAPRSAATAQPTAVAQPAPTPALPTPAPTPAPLAAKPEPTRPPPTASGPKPAGAIAIGGAPVAVTTSAPGQRSRLSFEAEAGRVVSVSHRDAEGRPGPSTRAGCVGSHTRLLGPDGQQLASTVSCGLIEATRLPVSGTYTIEVSMLDASTADLSLSLHDAG